MLVAAGLFFVGLGIFYYVTPWKLTQLFSPPTSSQAEPTRDSELDRLRGSLASVLVGMVLLVLWVFQ